MCDPARESDLDEATAFVRLLLCAAQDRETPIHVLLTMRLDFLGDCTRFAGLAEAINDGQFLVPRLNRAERRQAIEEPAKKFGRSIAPGLVQRILNEVGDDPDQLPVMHHALMRSWAEAGEAPRIELAHYSRGLPCPWL